MIDRLLSACRAAVDCRPAARSTVVAIFFSLVIVSASAGAEGESVDAVMTRFTKAWGNAAWEPAGARRPGYLRPAGDTGWAERMRALQSIVRAGKEAGAGLKATLKNGAPPARSLAAQALGFIRDVDSRDALAAAAEHDSDPVVRLYAVDSLGMLGAGPYEPLLKRLLDTEPNKDVNRHLSYALQRSGTPSEAHVIDALRTWDADRMATAAVDQPAPDFELLSLANETIRLSDYRNRAAVVLIFVYGDT